ncbi:MAG: hypothetical protein P8M36_07120 [Gammaproteobacteria bacterium]|nr:hypothetical protein [Gammaproteobacteria bacterium]
MWVESGYQLRPAYGTLAIENNGESWELYIDGGPAVLLSLNEENIRFELDWLDLRDTSRISVLEGVLDNGVILGFAREGSEERGAWKATKLVEQSDSVPPNPIDLTGIWGPPDYIGKNFFDLTDAGLEAQENYDSTLDDPMLRCMSDGMIRMSHGPFDIEVLDAGNRLVMLYEDMHEVRRVYLDRGFPESTESLNQSMGYSIGHWEGSTLVVETRGLKRSVWDAPGMPISPEAIFTERWYLDDRGILHIEFSMDDPENYYRPLLMHQVRTKLSDDSEVAPYSCDPHPFYRGLDIEGRLEEYWERYRYRL